MLEPIIRAEAKKRQQEFYGNQHVNAVPQNSAEVLKPIETRNELAKIAGVSRKEPYGNFGRFKPYLIYCNMPSNQF